MAEQPARDGSEELLLAEHRYLAEAFWHNEDGGEKRINFFITLVTAVLGALVALATKRGSLTDGQISGIAFAACLSLLVVGILTFLRLIRRNQVTDGYKRSMDHIREMFRAAYPRLADYEPFPRQTGGVGTRAFGRGGLTDLVAAVNSVIGAAALAALVALSGSAAALVAVSMLGFVLFLAAHAAYLEHRYHGRWLHPSWRRLLPRPREPREVEATLVVISETPEAVLRAIEELDEIAGYALGAARSERIRDRYLDTPDRQLARRKIALRIREIDGRVLVTLKGGAAVGRWGSEDRPELEHVWSDETWTKVRNELERLGVELDRPPAANSSRPTALETLGADGLELIQDREAARRVREVRAPRGRQGSVAELALDAVTYHLSDRDVRHYEVEIEAKARHGAEAVASAATWLVDHYWPSLRPWRHAKLPTGKAVAALLEEGVSRELIGDGGALEPRTYDTIADRLEPDPKAAATPRDAPREAD